MRWRGVYLKRSDESESESHSVLSDTLQGLYGLYSPKLLGLLDMVLVLTILDR